MTSKEFKNEFRKACFDLVQESKDIRSSDPGIADLLVKQDEDGLWIRFTAIGALLDYCWNNETESVFSYCVKSVVLASRMVDVSKGGD